MAKFHVQIWVAEKFLHFRTVYECIVPMCPWLLITESSLRKNKSPFLMALCPSLLSICGLCRPYPGMINQKTNVIWLQSPPYSMYKDSSKRLTGNDVFEGYAIDLIKEVADTLSKFKNPFCKYYSDPNLNNPFHN